MVTGEEATRKTKARKRNTIESSSCDKTEASKRRVNVSVVGAHIERELDLAGSNDTLARWMAHRIAELIGAEALASSAAEKAEAKAQTQALILELWEMRAALPGRVDPTARLRGAIEVLEKLSSNERYFYEHASVGGRAEQQALKAHHNTSMIMRSLALVKLATDFAVYDTDETNLPLSHEEVALRRLLDEAMASAVSRRIFVASAENAKDSKPNVDLLRDKIVATIDETLISLNELRESITGDSASAVQFEERAKRKRTPPARRLGSRRRSI